MISTFLTLKQNGVLLIMIIIKLNAFMHIIFKISEESLIFLNTKKNFVTLGRAALLSLATKKDANNFRHVISVMVGKSSNFTLWYTKPSHVK